MNPRLKALADRRDTIKAQLETYDKQVIERGKDLEGVEAENYAKLDAELTSVCASHDEIVKRELAVAGTITMASKLGGTSDKPGTDGKPVVNARAKGDDAELIYRAGGEHDPIRDVLLAARGNHDAMERMNKHNAANAERVSFVDLSERASGTSDLGGLVVPKYLTELYAPTAHELRPYVDSIQNLPLEAYTTVIPVGSTGTTATVPSAQGVAYDVQSPTSTALTLTATTVAGVAELSVEAVTFGAYSQALLYQDLYRAYWQTTDVQALRGSAANGQVEGLFLSDNLNSVTGTSATSGAPELYVKVVEAAMEVYQGIFMEATHVLMSAARWYRILSELDPDKRPLFGISDSAPTNVMGVAQPGRKTFAGLTVVIDENIYAGTTDTAVVVYRASEHLFFEQGAQVITVDQAKAAQGIVQYIARGFIQYTAERRPRAATLVTGLPVPSFA